MGPEPRWSASEHADRPRAIDSLPTLTAQLEGEIPGGHSLVVAGGRLSPGRHDDVSRMSPACRRGKAVRLRGEPGRRLARPALGGGGILGKRGARDVGAGDRTGQAIDVPGRSRVQRLGKGPEQPHVHRKVPGPGERLQVTISDARLQPGGDGVVHHDRPPKLAATALGTAVECDLRQRDGELIHASWRFYPDLQSPEGECRQDDAEEPHDIDF